MSLNHHIQAKTATDEVLGKFKRTEWKCANGLGQDFYRVGISADFPSPDAAFYDPTNKIIVSFEFKPPTESKRGILTGVGQCIAYLQNSDISYLIAPRMLEDYPLGEYLTSLYANQLYEKIPAGLILYENDNPSQMTLAQNVAKYQKASSKPKLPKVERFWAKHQDLPIPLFHLILHYYYLKKTDMISGDPFAECWRGSMISPTVLDDFRTVPIYDLSGKEILTLGTKKPMTYLEKVIPNLKGSIIERREKLEQKIDPTRNGNTSYNSIKKNLVSFIKSMQMIDSEGGLTESGVKLYHLGLVNGASSKIFTDYFTKELLTIGHHLDVIFDFDTLMRKTAGADVKEILSVMEIEYECKGYIKRNPNRKQSDESRVEFLKYERIIWKALELIDDEYNVQWKRITEVCSLPDL